MQVLPTRLVCERVLLGYHHPIIPNKQLIVITWSEW